MQNNIKVEARRYYFICYHLTFFVDNTFSTILNIRKSMFLYNSIQTLLSRLSLNKSKKNTPITTNIAENTYTYSSQIYPQPKQNPNPHHNPINRKGQKAHPFYPAHHYGNYYIGYYEGYKTS